MSDSASSNEDFLEALAALQVRLKDALAGFDEIRKKAEPEIAGITAEFIALHTRHELDLSKALHAHGKEPDEDGSFFSTIQRLVIKTRAVFDEIDDDILEQVASGEERIIGLYDDALSQRPSAPEQAVLTAHRGELHTLVTKARSMAD